MVAAAEAGLGLALLPVYVGDAESALDQLMAFCGDTITEADVLLHVRDISHPDTNAQKRDVENVLKSLFGTEGMPDNVIEVCNKADLLDAENKTALRTTGAFVISAVTGEGLLELLSAIEKEMANSFFIATRYTLDARNGKPLAWLHAHGKVMALTPEDEYIHVEVSLSQENIRRFEQLYGDKV
jgi:GTP-binding protein HflX